MRCEGGEGKYLVKLVLLQHINCVGDLNDLGLFIWLDVLHAWSVPLEVSIVLGSTGKGSLGAIVALAEGIFDSVHGVQSRHFQEQL